MKHKRLRGLSADPFQARQVGRMSFDRCVKYLLGDAPPGQVQKVVSESLHALRLKYLGVSTLDECFSMVTDHHYVSSHCHLFLRCGKRFLSTVSAHLERACRKAVKQFVRAFEWAQLKNSPAFVESLRVRGQKLLGFCPSGGRAQHEIEACLGAELHPAS